jgi:hypothetical protein
MEEWSVKKINVPAFTTKHERTGKADMILVKKAGCIFN